MGGMASKIGGIFNPTIAGTGQTASDLSKIGYSPDELKTLDPGAIRKAGLLKGAFSGIGGALQGGPQTGQVATGPAFTPPSVSPVDPGYFSGTQFGRLNSGRSPIYG